MELAALVVGWWMWGSAATWGRGLVGEQDDRQRDAWWGGASVTTLGVTLRGGRRDAALLSWLSWR